MSVEPLVEAKDVALVYNDNAAGDDQALDVVPRVGLRYVQNGFGD